jgi:hypothetical protein
MEEDSSFANTSESAFLSDDIYMLYTMAVTTLLCVVVL